MDIFRKSLAPITDEAWEEINVQSKDYLESILSARKFVDVEGPHGWEFHSVPAGRLEIQEEPEKSGVKFGLHKVLPLVEVRVPFKLNQWELDNITRGAKDTDLSNMEKAAKQIAEFEERTIYYGLTAASIKGIKDSSTHSTKECPKKGEDILSAIMKGIVEMKEHAVDGPYSLVVNPQKWLEITTTLKGYPLQKQLESLLKGKIIFCPNIKEIFLVSERGGDFKLTLGVDLSIGYESISKNDVQLYFTESFTFQVFDPAAVMIYK